MKYLFLLFTCLFSFHLSAQLIETFDGPEITSTYPWQGDLNRFMINDDHELQLKGISQTDEEYLYLASCPLLSNEWRLKVRSDYQWTTGNYLRIYLWSENPDTKYSGDAIVVRLGYKNKNISLCHQRSNISDVILLQGRTLFNKASEVEIRITTDAQGACTIFSRCKGEETFILEGTAQLPELEGNGYFMLAIKHSAAHNRDKYIDDLSISRFSLDESPEEPEDPDQSVELLSLEQLDTYSLLLTYNQPVIAEYASFVLTDLGEVDTIYQSLDGELLKLIWIKPIVKERNYQLAFSGLYDETMNSYSGIETFFSKDFTEKPEEPDEIPKGAIRINEVMADPNGLTELPQTEYVELYNCSSEPIEMKNIIFTYDSKKINLQSCLLPGDSYLVLYREGREILLYEKGIKMPLPDFPAQLANTGKMLALYDKEDRLIDEMIYKKATPGRSWERYGEEWHLSNDWRGGTPGGVNSEPSTEPEEPKEPEIPEEPEEPESIIFSQDIIFNELLLNPHEGGSEYIELFNRSNKSLLLTELSIALRNTEGNLQTNYSLASIPFSLQPGGYVVLTKDIAGVTNFYQTGPTDGLCEIKMPILHNNSSTLVLFRTKDKMVIDEVSYHSKWHDTIIKDEKGVALERINPDEETQAEKNWTSATFPSGYGTPGYQNSQYGKEKEGESSSGIEKPCYSPELGVYTVLYHLDQSGYKCRASIYNLSGVRVVEFANNILLGIQGKLTWNGLSEQGGTLIPGPYILYIELFNNNGKIKRYKEVFLVH